MSLATRCTACHTVFRVVQDQLKVSEGWVRCGRCSEVFNALEGLFDLDTQDPQHLQSAQVAAGTATQDGARDPGLGLSQDDLSDLEDPTRLGHIDEQLLGSPLHTDRSTPARRVSERDRLEFPDAQFDSDLLAEEGDSDGGYGPALLQRSEESPPPPPAPAPDQAPAFVSQAQRRQRWHSPARRALLGAVAVLLLGALTLQVADHERDLVAARWPVLTPALNAWCELARCTLQAPRIIDDLVVENSALERSPTVDGYQLTVALRNRGSLTVALPAVDLSLTDPGGQLVSRRVLTPQDFRSASTVIAAGAESNLQLLLSTGGVRVSGYTVEIFYP